jgi:DNA-binding beta-propeller fold protein YncE
MAVDLATGQVSPRLIEAEGVHGALPLPGSNLVLSSNGKSNDATLFDGASGKIEAKFPTGASPDVMAVEPKSGLVAIFNGKSQDATLYDPRARAVVGSINVGGKPEFAVGDGQGRLLLNLEDKATIAVIDVAARKVTGHFALPGCESPTGLALAKKLGVLIAACDNKVAKIIDAATGKDLATLSICDGPDGAMVDERRSRAFIPCGDGTMSVLALPSREGVAVAATVATGAGARTGAVDEATGRVYLAAAKFTPAKGGEKPQAIPGSFEILVLSDAN